MSKEDLLQWLLPLARRWGLAEALAQQRAVFAWERAVGPNLASLARPLYVDREVLHLGVPSHVVAAELHLLAAELLARLAEVAPGSGVKELRFHVRAEPGPPPEVTVPPPSPRERRLAEQELSAHLPEGLRDKLAGIVAWARARDQAILAAGGSACRRCGVAFLGPGDLCPVCAVEAPRDRG
ncbi:MAG: DUF721 domain-containing protein [Candidatus Acetothermia bacterium]|nr:DUF721 domain-containing protein [Candidatus Acetothermia bacterium]